LAASPKKLYAFKNRTEKGCEKKNKHRTEKGQEHIGRNRTRQRDSRKERTRKLGQKE
jgi:hypothetical protein